MVWDYPNNSKKMLVARLPLYPSLFTRNLIRNNNPPTLYNYPNKHLHPIGMLIYNM